MYEKFIKRFLDILFSLIGLIVSSPILLIVITVLFITNRGEVFFTQDRPGKNAKIFKIIKFRSMNNKKDNEGKLLPDEMRLTRMGYFIRLTSLDEIPQLINILRGDMSLIGPRPLLVKYLPLYTTKQFSRHLVRPGITGLAQVKGRNNISWERKFKLDADYVNNLSFYLDMKIFFLTFKKLFTREGVKKDGCATTETFTGTK